MLIGRENILNARFPSWSVWWLKLWFEDATEGHTFNSLRPSDAYMRQWSSRHWFRKWIVAWSAPSHYLNQYWNIVSSNDRCKIHTFLFKKMHLNMSSGKWPPFCLGLDVLIALKKYPQYPREMLIKMSITHFYIARIALNYCFSRLFHASTSTTSSGCLVLHRTVHSLWNLYGNPYRSHAEEEEETVTWSGNSSATPRLFIDWPITTAFRSANHKPW